MVAVETRELRKHYTSTKKAPGIAGALRALIRPERMKVEAVRGIDLRVESGELVGFLGPNGAGKTTTLKMLSGILHPSSGECRVLGYQPFERRPEMLRQISLVMGNKNQLWWDLPAMDSFAVLRELFEIDASDYQSRLKRLLEALELEDKVSTQVRKLSLGERMKCELVAALLHRPAVLFLDEPTIGLDLISQQRIREFLRELHREEGCTILLTSHYMQDVRELCDRVVVIDKGQKVFDDSLEALTRAFGDARRVRLTLSREVAPEELARFGRVADSDGLVVAIEVPPGDTALRAGAMLQSLPVVDVAIEEPDIEDAITSLFRQSREQNHEPTGG
ncbi:MAG: ATP-binding cassette domain-containing protein [Fimbriimonadaceae bacterium]|nr:ATP-binding cassette domain-containing protein [Fimbriimonadaceae bacterium]